MELALLLHPSPPFASIFITTHNYALIVGIVSKQKSTPAA